MERPAVKTSGVGIAGGTGSAKTTVAEMIARGFGLRRAAQDSDHLDAIDVATLR
jgi:uridine kinase